MNNICNTFTRSVHHIAPRNGRMHAPSWADTMNTVLHITHGGCSLYKSGQLLFTFLHLPLGQHFDALYLSRSRSQDEYLRDPDFRRYDRLFPALFGLSLNFGRYNHLPSKMTPAMKRPLDCDTEVNPSKRQKTYTKWSHVFGSFPKSCLTMFLATVQ